MRINALAVANYFVELSKRDGVPIYLLGLVKRVYIAHGFSLAIDGRGLLDPRFDKAEAWKYGPVIPSVYHSFKYNKREAITQETVAVLWEGSEERITTPRVEDERAKRIIEGVWKRYIKFKDSDLVSILHRKGTPWSMVYKEGQNNEIPDLYTEFFYKKLVKVIQERKESRKKESYE